MTDRPILFSGPMVRALLDGRKTQTRRVIDFPGIDKVIDFVRVAFDKETGAPVYEMKDAAGQFLTRPAGKSFVDYHYSPRFAVGDRLYVREAWRTAGWLDGTAPRDLSDNVALRYEADPVDPDNLPLADGRFRQGMHMPRWASRLTLIVTDVRVQRLQVISEADAIAEGIHVQRLAEWAAQGVYVGEGNKPILMAADDPSVAYMANADADCSWYTAREAFTDLWDSLNEARGYGWDTNPWVVAVTFTVERRNIDQVAS